MATLEEIKAKQQKMWSAGDYGKIAWMTQPLADVLVEAAGIRAGATVLDVATGTGHVALAAARRFSETTGLDYVPALLEVGRRRAAAEGLDVTFTEGDAENLPFPDGSFDYVFSAIGAMFAPNQPQVAAELVRVARPGGTVAMLNWTPTGFVGELFSTIAKHVPPPPEIKPAALWGNEEHVRGLFGETVSSITFKSGTHPQHYLSAPHYADFFVENYGPTNKAFEALSPEARAAFRDDLVALAERFNTAGEGAVVVASDYTVVVATKR